MSDQTENQTPTAEDAPVGVEKGTTGINGPQPVPAVPEMPNTVAEFQDLLVNPDAPAQNQSAPPQELLNPHLFG